MKSAFDNNRTQDFNVIKNTMEGLVKSKNKFEDEYYEKYFTYQACVVIAVKNYHKRYLVFALVFLLTFIVAFIYSYRLRLSAIMEYFMNRDYVNQFNQDQWRKEYVFNTWINVLAVGFIAYLCYVSVIGAGVNQAQVGDYFAMV